MPKKILKFITILTLMFSWIFFSWSQAEYKPLVSLEPLTKDYQKNQEYQEKEKYEQQIVEKISINEIISDIKEDIQNALTKETPVNENISNIQEDIQNVPTEIEEEPIPIVEIDPVYVQEDPYSPPGKRKGDIIFSEVSDENTTAVLVSRQSLSEPQELTYELWIFPITATSSQQELILKEYDLSLEPQTLIQEQDKEWRFITGPESISRNATILFSDGHLFWFEPPDENGVVLWRFNLSTNGYDSMSANVDETLRFYFENQASGKQVFEIGITGDWRILDVIPLVY